MDIFKLFGTIAVENSTANAAIEDTNKKASNFSDNLKKGVTTVAKWGVAIGTAAVAGGAALTKVATSAASTADEIDKMSQKIGISKEGYQEWSYVLGQNGMDISSLQNGMKTLVTQMDAAASGTESSMEAFQALGISVTDSNGKLKSQEDMMNETLVSLASMENGTEKARLATELFGKSGVELMPMLNQGAGGITDLKDRAHELGLIMSDDAVTAGVKLGDTMDDVKQSVTAMATRLGASLMPILQKVCDMILKYLPSIQGMFDSLSPVVTDLFEQLMPPLMDMVSQIMPVLIDVLTTLIPPLTEIVTALLPIFTQLIQMVVPFLLQIVQAILPVVTTLLQTLLPIFQTVIDLLTPILQLFMNLLAPIVELISNALTPLITIIGELINAILTPLQPILETICNVVGAILTPIIEALAPVFQMVSEALAPLMELFGTLIGTILKPIQPILEAVGRIFSEVLGGAIQAVMPIISGIMDVFGGLIDFITGIFTGNWKKAWNGIVKVFKGIFNLIPTAVEAVINLVIKLINGITGGINKVTGLLGIPAIPAIPNVKLPRLAKGGVVKNATTAIVGEDGDEAIVPLEKNTEWIDKVAEKLNGGMSGSAVIDKFNELITLIQRMKIYLDSGVLVGELTPAIDASLGQYYTNKGRGR